LHGSLIAEIQGGIIPEKTKAETSIRPNQDDNGSIGLSAFIAMAFNH
jgi:hypothetical protein